jgi:hypothetical protein
MDRQHHLLHTVATKCRLSPPTADAAGADHAANNDRPHTLNGEVQIIRRQHSRPSFKLSHSLFPVARFRMGNARLLKDTHGIADLSVSTSSLAYSGYYKGPRLAPFHN